ncbi:MAG: hypothetical protein IJ991_11115 [Thermoguttaceae bacterium]|nr:hypothetical protein [Thermoguttaceae bacterium]
MPKNKRKSVSENVAEKNKKGAKSVSAEGGKKMRTGAATLTICAAAFGAYYSPHFRTASSDWLERGRALVGQTSSTDAKAFASATDKAEKKLAQAPSFRDFLNDEYGEEGARELLGIEETATDVANLSKTNVGFADYVAAESSASEPSESSESSEPSIPQGVASSWDAPSLATSPGPGASFADYVAAESSASEPSESSEPSIPQGVASSWDAPSLPTSPEPGASFADYVAAENDVETEINGTSLSVEKTDLAASSSGENEAALTARLQSEMKERGVGNPRIERWGGRFWRASGFATTDEGVATFCEAVDVDPTAAQRAALAKFNAARF